MRSHKTYWQDFKENDAFFKDRKWVDWGEWVKRHSDLGRKLLIEMNELSVTLRTENVMNEWSVTLTKDGKCVDWGEWASEASL